MNLSAHHTNLISKQISPQPFRRSLQYIFAETSFPRRHVPSETIPHAYLNPPSNFTHTQPPPDASTLKAETGGL